MVSKPKTGPTGQKWQQTDREQWLAEQSVKRSYQDDVLSIIKNFPRTIHQDQYGALSYNPERYPLLGLRSFTGQPSKPLILITGGVHGYETSGVHGALRFVEDKWQQYKSDFDLLVAPCISPWGYETINRWNPFTVDPNRSFTSPALAEESSAVMDWVASFNTPVLMHIDLHETTDTDNTQFRPALSARDNVEHPFWEIPDGFYLVGDTQNPCPEFQKAIIQAVEQVTHIAPADSNNKIIGEMTAQHGVINYETKALGLCTGFSNARFNTTTEVYPDSPLVDEENCILAQVTTVSAGIDYAIEYLHLKAKE